MRVICDNEGTTFRSDELHHGARAHGWRAWDGILRARNDAAGSVNVVLYSEITNEEITRVELTGNMGLSSGLFTIPEIYRVEFEGHSGDISVTAVVDGDTGRSLPKPPGPLLSGFDFTSGNDYEIDGGAIGMTSPNALDYPRHNLAPDPALEQMVRFSGDLTAAPWTKGDSAVTKVNERDWLYTQGATGALRQSYPALDTDHISHSVFIPDGGSARFIRMLMGGDGNYVQAWWDHINKRWGTFNTLGDADAITIADPVREADGWRIRFYGRAARSGTLCDFWFACVTTNGSTTRDTGATVMLREPYAHPGDVALPYVESGNNAALSNWTLNGNNGGQAKLLLVERNGQCWLRLENLAPGSAAYAQQNQADVTNPVPHGMGVRLVVTDGQAKAGISNGIDSGFQAAGYDGFASGVGTPAVGDKLRVTADANGACEWRDPEQVRGGTFFGVRSGGEPKSYIRVQAGVGAQERPGHTNKCLNNSVAPTDTTNVTDLDGATTTAYSRGSIAPEVPAGLMDALDAFNEDRTYNVYRTQFSGAGRAYVTGATGGTGAHYARALMWPVAGAVSPAVGIENTDVEIAAHRDSWAWVGGSVPAPAATDRFTVSGLSGEVWWIANSLIDGAKPREHVPTNGSVAAQGSDAPTDVLERLGLDLGRNSLKQTSVRGAAVGTFPDNWVNFNAGPLTVSVSAVGSDYIDVLVSGEQNTGLCGIFPQQTTDVVAASGQTWFGVFDAAIVAGSVANVDKIELTLSERNAAGSTQGTYTPLNITDLLTADRRTYAVSRTLTEGGTERLATGLYITGGNGPVNLTLRIWCGEDIAWALQKSLKLQRRPLTTGTPVVPFKAAIDGFTIILDQDAEELDTAQARFINICGANPATDRLSIRTSSGANTDKAQIVSLNEGTFLATGTTALTPGANNILEFKVQEGSQSLSINGNAPVTLLAALSSDLTKFILGNYQAGAVNSPDCVLRSVQTRQGTI